MSTTKEESLRFSYNKLFKLLIDRGIKKKELCEMAEISATSVAKLGHGKNVNTEVLLKICDALNCDVGDIMEFLRDDNAKIKFLIALNSTDF